MKISGAVAPAPIMGEIQWNYFGQIFLKKLHENKKLMPFLFSQ